MPAPGALFQSTDRYNRMGSGSSDRAIRSNRGLEIQSENKGARVILNERVFVTKDGGLVKAGDPAAVALYCAPGHSVSRADYESRMPPKAKAKAKAATKGKE